MAIKISKSLPSPFRIHQDRLWSDIGLPMPTIPSQMFSNHQRYLLKLSVPHVMEVRHYYKARGQLEATHAHEQVIPTSVVVSRATKIPRTSLDKKVIISHHFTKRSVLCHVLQVGRLQLKR